MIWSLKTYSFFCRMPRACSSDFDKTKIKIVSCCFFLWKIIIYTIPIVPTRKFFPAQKK